VVRACCEKAGLEHIAPHDLRRTCAKLCHSSGGELEQIQFLLGHVSVQTAERYLGCKQNLGRPVNDLFDLRMEGQTPEKDRESVAANGVSEAVEKAFEQGIECRQGDRNMTSPPANQGSYPYQNEPTWSKSEKAIARTASDAALGRELHEVIQKKQIADKIQQSSDLWDLEHFLTERRKEIDRKSDYRYSRLTQLFRDSCKKGYSGKKSYAG
jgi:hypothetical protein